MMGSVIFKTSRIIVLEISF